MQYQKIHPAVFRARPNRFVAQVELAGETVTCHVKNRICQLLKFPCLL